LKVEIAINVLDDELYGTMAMLQCLCICMFSYVVCTLSQVRDMLIIYTMSRKRAKCFIIKTLKVDNKIPQCGIKVFHFTSFVIARD